MRESRRPDRIETDKKPELNCRSRGTEQPAGIVQLPDGETLEMCWLHDAVEDWQRCFQDASGGCRVRLTRDSNSRYDDARYNYVGMLELD
jgi:hypothetical protein